MHGQQKKKKKKHEHNRVMHSHRCRAIFHAAIVRIFICVIRISRDVRETRRFDYDFEVLYKNIQLATLLKHAGKQLHSGDGQYEISTPHSLHTYRCVGIPRFSFFFFVTEKTSCLPTWMAIPLSLRCRAH